MARFKIYKHSVLGYEVVKEGFSWPGFFFTWIWAFVKKLYIQGAILLPVVFLANSMAIGMIDVGYEFKPTQGDDWAGLVVILIFLVLPEYIVGKKGNGWREKNMLQRGFELLGSFEAASADGALAESHKYYK